MKAVQQEYIARIQFSRQFTAQDSSRAIAEKGVKFAATARELRW